MGSPKSNYRYWSKRELWSLEEAIWVLLGVNPFSNVREVRDLGRFNAVYSWAKDAVDVGTLKPFSGGVGKRGDEPYKSLRFRPKDILTWAHGKDIPIPPELSPILDRSQNTTSQILSPAPGSKEPARTQNKRQAPRTREHERDFHG